MGAVHLEITPRFSGALKVSLPLTAWPEPKRYPLEKLTKLEGAARNQQTIWYPGHMAAQQCKAEHGVHDTLLRMTAKPEGANTLIAEAAALDWPADLHGSSVTQQQSNMLVESRCLSPPTGGIPTLSTNLSPSHRPPAPEIASRRPPPMPSAAGPRIQCVA